MLLEVRKYIRQVLWENEEKSQVKKNREHVQKLFQGDKERFNKRAALYPDMFIDEVGLDVILDFLKAEDGTNFHLAYRNFDGATDYSKELEKKPGASIPDLQRQGEIANDLKKIKARLFYYFSRRMFANISHDEDWTSWTTDDLFKWMEVYKERFLYEYLIPFSKLADR